MSLLAKLASCIVVALPCALHFTGATMLSAQSHPHATATPSPSDLYARFVEASGGAGLWRSVQSVRIRARRSDADGGSYDVAAACHRDGRSVIEERADDVGMHAGFDGTLTWSDDVAQGRRVVKGLAPKVPTGRVECLMVNPDVPTRYQRAQTTRQVIFDGTLAWEVDFPTDGLPGALREYFDVATGLWRGYRAYALVTDGPPSLEVVHRDFRRVDGLLRPFEVEDRMPSLSRQRFLTYKSFEFNSDVDAELVAPEWVRGSSGPDAD